MLPIKFKVNKPFDSGKEAKNRFSSQLAFQFRKRSEKLIFKMAAMATIMDFR